MKTLFATALLAAAIAVLLSACSAHSPPAEVHRPIRAVAVRYAESKEVRRYFASVQSRYEVEQAFRVAGKVSARRVDVGQKVRAKDILAVLDDADYRLAEDAARRQLEAATARQRQAESDWQRLQALKQDGSVSAADEEHARSALDTARAAARAEARKLDLARNQLSYTVLRASRDGVVTQVRVEVAQVVAAGQPVIAVADPGEPEIVADIPEAHLGQFKRSVFRAVLPGTQDGAFAVELRELSAQAAAQTRTYRARLKPLEAQVLPLGATARLLTEHEVSEIAAATLPAAALTQLDGKPAVWVAQPLAGPKPVARVALQRVEVLGYRNDDVLIAGPADGTLVVAAGVQKMAPGLIVAMPTPAEALVAVQGAP